MKRNTAIRLNTNFALDDDCLCVGPTTSLRKRKRRLGWRQFTALAITLSLSACSTFGGDEENQVPLGRVGFVKGFIGGIAADEPCAVLIGREVLSAGGSAADAATAVYFAMSVILPSAASLGGGGMCLIRDHETQAVEVLDFRARPPSSSRPAGLRPVAVPGNPRGFFALHAKYGRLKWGELLRPAENLARFGTQVSKALAADLRIAGRLLGNDPRMWGAFKGDDNRLVREGGFLDQLELAATLGRLRSRGGGDFYSGPFARQFAQAVTDSGSALNYDDLRAFVPKWGRPITVPFIRSTNLYFPAGTGDAGLIAAEMMAMLNVDDAYEDADGGERAHLIAETAERALAEKQQLARSGGSVAGSERVTEGRAEQLMGTYSSEQRRPVKGAAPAPVQSVLEAGEASLAVLDQRGSVVACSVTMNRPFGAGMFARDSGVLMAAPPLPGREGESLSAMILASTISNSVFYASASSGGAVAPTALVNVAAKVLLDEESDLSSSLAAKRIHHGGSNGVTYAEKGTPRPILEGLVRRGHRTALVERLGNVNSVYCSTGLPAEIIDCGAGSDLRGLGIASSSD